jgi:hypothetical protein
MGDIDKLMQTYVQEVAVLVNIDGIEDEKATIELPLLDLVAYGTQLSKRNPLACLCRWS